MKVSANVENLWDYIQSMSLSERNRKWLAEKLLNDVPKNKETDCISKDEVLAGIDAGLKEVRLTRDGKLSAKTAREFLYEL